MSTILPRPTVTAENSAGGAVDVTISRDGKSKTYTGKGFSETTRTADVVEKILNDPHSAEYLPGKNEKP